jgi:hypothetical protein
MFKGLTAIASLAGACPVADELGQGRRAKLHDVAHNWIARGGRANGELPIYARRVLTIRALRRRDRNGRNCGRRRRRHAGVGRIMPTQGPSQGSLAGTFYGGASGDISCAGRLVSVHLTNF